MRSRIPIALAGCLALSGCGGHVVPMVLAGISAAKSGYDITKEITEVVDPVIGKACAVYEVSKGKVYQQAALGMTTSRANTKVSSLASFADAACANPPDGDPLQTALWIVQVGAKMEAVAHDDLER